MEWDWPPRKTLTLSGTINSASTHLSEVGLKGSDLLQRVNWHINLAGNIDGSHQGVSSVLQYNGLPVSITADLHWFELDLGEQNWDIAGINTEYAGVGLDVSRHYRFGAFSGYQGILLLGMTLTSGNLMVLPLSKQRAFTCVMLNIGCWINKLGE